MIAATVLSAASLAAEFHVSPHGKDDNPGSREKPFATLERAPDAVRQSPLRQGTGQPRNRAYA